MFFTICRMFFRTFEKQKDFSIISTKNPGTQLKNAGIFYSINFQPFLPNAFSFFSIVYGTGNKLQIVAE